MAWVAMDRAIKSAEKHQLKAPLEHWRTIRARIHDDACARGFSEKTRLSFRPTAAKNSTRVCS